ncbi:helix-turn-helix transcriptional regulator [Actinomadura keratinilytica]|uniref:Helix-turn-helix transcriptional regulator n=1 Tax=Actinomadura keratinilytica TaxID=547461 RepID=A0ABP7Y2H4_9ACTN
MSDDAYGDPQPAASGLAAPRRALSVRLPSLARAPEPGPDEMAPGPTVARMLLGARLRALREERGVSRAEAGELIRGSESKISRMETGRTGFKERDLADLLTLYGVTDEAERAVLLALAEQAGTPGWWQPYHELIPQWYETYLGLEQSAEVIRCHESHVVPELLQTPDYARAVIALTHGDEPAETVERRVELRMRRSLMLERSRPPHLWVMIDEAVLRRPFGGAEVMREQLRHLAEMSRLPHVTVQVMPFAAGGYPGVGGPITLLRQSEAELPDVVYLARPNGAEYVDKPEDVEAFRHTLNQMAMRAEPAPETPRILRAVIDGC